MTNSAKSRWLAAPIAALALSFLPASAEETVRFASRDGTSLRAIVIKPGGDGPFPAVIGLHGCAGLRAGGLDARSADWAGRLVAAGFLVIFPDSFGSRGMGSACATRDRVVNASGRVADVAGAADWLRQQPFVQARRIAVIGWSNGGGTALRAAALAGTSYSAVIAFYPGCRTLLQAGWRPRVPTTILQGGADDWTPAAPCAALAAASGARYLEFPGAHHDFDHPGLTLRQRRAATAQNPSGQATIGTDPAARAGAMQAVMAILRGL
jgi:dienelactone hydrolase